MKTWKRIWILAIIVNLFFIVLFYGCDSEEDDDSPLDKSFADDDSGANDNIQDDDLIDDDFLHDDDIDDDDLALLD